MKLKKSLIIMMSTIIAIAVVGCSSKEEKTQNANNQSQVESNDNKEVEKTTYFGKVKKLIGNEVELELAKLPSEDELNGTLEDGSNMEMGGESTMIDMTEEQINSVMNGEGPEDLSGEVIVGEVSGDDLEEMKLEYTGEFKNFIIPAGVEVFDLRSQSESKVSAIKEGSVIKIYADDNSDNPLVSKIEIVE